MGMLRIARASSTAFALAATFLADSAAAQATQSADLAVAFPAAPTSTTPAGTATSFGGFVPVTDKNGNLVAPTTLSFGKTIKYVFTVSNNGPNHATGVAVNIAPPTGTTVTAVSGATCSKNADTGNPDVTKSCAISADMENGATPIDVTVTVHLDVPKTAPATCPGGTALGTFTATVVTDANTTDPDPANNVARVAGTGVALNPYTDVGIAIDGPVNGAVGESVTYTATVTNSGPCPAANVAVTFLPGNVNGPNTLLAFESGTGVCGTADAVANGCTIGDMTAGQTVTFTNIYKITALPTDVIQTTIPIEYDVATDTTDANSKNDAATSGIRVGKEAGGCNSGGPGGLVAVALMAAAVFAARRRRTA
jgi:uncharacterized repeat protein (TIGR01451 family)/uncharacterized protein (TIGR03382 family)